LDAKGRLAIPTKYREPLAELCGGRLIATIDHEESCLLVYPMNEWLLIEKQLQAMPSMNPMVRRVQRMILGHASELELDGSGRVLLPSELRDHASMEKEIVLVGQGKRLEMWSKANWDRCREEFLATDMNVADMPPELQSFSL
ncbi:MAG: division/cell wall cluster transcriptional repressor MraZ, partial [Oleibacter sp.]|nr:division/cell wall cluster transcriptional repressor MraZ [Thalassolituus sp.]